MPPHILAECRRLITRVPALLKQLSEHFIQTLVHGDFFINNIMVNNSTTSTSDSESKTRCVMAVV
jgi:Ser/Thr protein kinase RdoA (MazF antagonist)